MARPSGKTLLALVVSLVACGFAGAQNDVREAVKLVRLGQPEEALNILRGLIKTDPTSEEALALFRSIDADGWARLLLEEGELGKYAESLLQRARTARKDRNRDAETIEALAEIACTSGDYGERTKAISEMVANHGEFAVPALVARLNADDEDVLIRAMVALDSLGRTATLPVIEALKHGDASVRANAAAVLNHLGDHRAAAALAALAVSDSQESVRSVALVTLKKWGKANADAVALYLENARRFLDGSALRVGEGSDVVWELQDGALVAIDIAPEIYSQELALKNAEDAWALDVGSMDVKVAFAQACLAQAAVIEASLAKNPDHETLSGLEDKVGELEMRALATGPRILRAALEDARQRRKIQVAVGAAHALAAAEDSGSLADSPLVAALDDGDSRISYAAALALASASRGGAVPAAGKVVRVLAAAVTEEALRRITIIDGRPATAQAARQASMTRGMDISVSNSAVSGVSDLLSFPNVDVVVINEVLPQGTPEDVISVIRSDSRMAGVKIIIMAKDTDAAAERFDDVKVIEGELSGESLRQAIDEALDGEPMGPLEARANAVAIAASNALQSLAAGSVDVRGALANLQGQLNRGDEVSVPAVGAIGFGGGAEELGALVACIQGGSSDTLKIAAAKAVGRILGRTQIDVPGEAFEALVAVLGSDATAGLKSAIATALGKGKLAPGQGLKLVESLKTVAGGS